MAATLVTIDPTDTSQPTFSINDVAITKIHQTQGGSGATIEYFEDALTRRVLDVQQDSSTVSDASGSFIPVTDSKLGLTIYIHAGRIVEAIDRLDENQNPIGSTLTYASGKSDLEILTLDEDVTTIQGLIAAL